MQYCTHCKVYISTKTDFCPLCHRKIEKANETVSVQTFPEYKKPLKNKLGLTKLLINILAPLAIFVTVLVNLLTYNGVLWSLIDVMAIIYLWAFGMWTFKKDGSIGKKIVVNAIAINLIIISANIFGYNLATLPNEFWSISYVLPFLIAIFMLANNVIMFTKKHQIKDFILSQFSLCFIAFAVFIVAMSGFTSVLFPAFIVLSLAVLTLLTFALFGKKMIMQEFKKKFHL